MGIFMDNKELIIKENLQKIDSCKNLVELNDIQISILGKNGLITQEMKLLGKYEPDERKKQGLLLNSMKNTIEESIKNKREKLEEIELNEKLYSEKIDVTLPVKPEYKGRKHLLTQVSDELVSHFKSQGFEVMSGPEMDSDFNNFEALNIPKHHPARQEQDTFYISGITDKLLRTHTSTMQIRTLSNKKIPIRAVSIGSVFRNDAVDATHSPMFHQMEIFVVEPNVTMAHLKYCVLEFLSFLFNIDLIQMDKSKQQMPVRMRPSFFPFTEPSIEVDVCCVRKDGELKLDLNGKWLEILGCGMIHPNVFKNCGISKFDDGTEVRGFAIGVGIERIALLRYGITDIRNFYEGDMRWLNNYGSL